MDTILVLRVGVEEYRLSLPTRWAMEAEKRLGESMLSAMEHVDRVTVITVVLWASLQKLAHSMTIEKTADLIDAMMEKGCAFGGEDYEDFSIEVRTKLYTQLMVIGGFFTKEQAKGILESMAKK